MIPPACWKVCPFVQMDTGEVQSADPKVFNPFVHPIFLFPAAIIMTTTSKLMVLPPPSWMSQVRVAKISTKLFGQTSRPYMSIHPDRAGQCVRFQCFCALWRLYRWRGVDHQLRQPAARTLAFAPKWYAKNDSDGSHQQGQSQQTRILRRSQRLIQHQTTPGYAVNR